MIKSLVLKDNVHRASVFCSTRHHSVIFRSLKVQGKWIKFGPCFFSLTKRFVAQLLVAII